MPPGAGPGPGLGASADPNISTSSGVGTNTCSTTTASLQNNVAVLLLRRNNHETDEEEIRSNVVDAVRRFRKVISLTSSIADATSEGEDGASEPQGVAAAAADAEDSDDRGLAWFHRRLLAGDRSVGAGSSRSLHGPAGGGSGGHSSHSQLVANDSMRSLHLSNRSLFGHDQQQQQHPNWHSQDLGNAYASPMQHSLQLLTISPGVAATPGVGSTTPSTQLYGGCSGAAAVLGSPMRSPKKLPTAVKDVYASGLGGGNAAVPSSSSSSGGGAIISATGGSRKRIVGGGRRDSYGRARSESFPAQGLGRSARFATMRGVGGGGNTSGSGGNDRRDDNTAAAFFGLPPVPPLFESDDNGAIESLAAIPGKPVMRMGERRRGVSHGQQQQRDRADSLFSSSFSHDNSSSSAAAGVGRGSPPLPARPRSKSFALPNHDIPPPPFHEELDGGDVSGDGPSHHQSEHQMRLQEHREIRERTRREAIVANVVTQSAYHAPVADEVTPLGLEYIGEYVSVVLPHSAHGGGVVGGRRKGGEWAQVVRKNLSTRTSSCETSSKEDDVISVVDVAASARINLAAVLYYGLIGAQGFDFTAVTVAEGDNKSSEDSDGDRQEEKKEASVKDDEGLHVDIDEGLCDEDRRLELALSLLHEAANEAKSASLKVMANVNAGVVLFHRNKVRDAFAAFKKARDCLISTKDDITKFSRHIEVPHPTYLRSGTLLNVATLAVRLGDLDLASEAASEIDGGESNAASSSAGAYRAPRGGLSSFGGSYSGRSRPQFTKPPPTHIRRRIRWLQSVSTHHIRSLIRLRRPPAPPGSDSESDTGDVRSKSAAVLDAYNTLLAAARKELGHSHPVVGYILYHRGDALFNSHQLHPAMLSYLAALKIMECHTGTPDPPRRSDRLLYSRIWYGIGRTLHDREEFPDALRAYQRTLELQTSLTGGSDVCINVVQTLCNVGRVRHALGDIDGALEVHRRVVRIATALTEGRTGHPFVAARLRALGNLLVEAGRPAEAVQAYAEAARSTGEVCIGFTEEDVDGTESARQSARVLARAGLSPPCAAGA